MPVSPAPSAAPVMAASAERECCGIRKEVRKAQNGGSVLPSKLAVISQATSGKRMIAIDTAGVVVSERGCRQALATGDRCAMDRARCSGEGSRAESSGQWEACLKQSIARFQLTTDKHETWVSEDGKTWTLEAPQASRMYCLDSLCRGSGSNGVVFRRQRHVPQASSGCGENGVSDRRGDADNACFSCACRGQVLAVEQDDFDLRRVAEAGDAVFGEARILDAAIGEENSFEERSADALNKRALHLIAKTVGIDDGAALPGLHGAADLTFFVDGSTETSAQVAT